MTTAKRIAVMLVTLCAFTGGAVGGVASMPAAAPNAYAVASGGSVAATDAPVAVTDDPAAATDSSTERVSDCDLIDIDGNDSTVSVNISTNATAADGDGVTIQYHCGADDATTVDHDLIDIDGNDNSVTLVVRSDDGAIVFGENESVADSDGLRVALNCGGDTLADCDAIDIDGNNNTVTLVVRSDDGRTVHEFGAVEESVSYYQIDFVVGEPIENLRGPEGYYTPDRLIRFAHGSTDTPVMRRSEGEFLASGEQARCIESRNITVENGTAKTTFTVEEGCGPVTLTLASYEKVGPGWSPETEEEQEFVDAETHTFGPGTHTLSVDIPGDTSPENTSSHETTTDRAMTGVSVRPQSTLA